MSTVIKVEGVSKLYRLGEVGTGTLSHDLKRWWYKVRRKEDPYLKIGQVNDRTQRAEKGEMVWALRDISFEVKEGEVLGIIGRNGAGKSTLLKILSRITSPTEGVVKIKGRIASLLEVGTGFHPEMTGRENIYMNGTIMGMRRAEIDRRLDEIVEFAGIAKYLDTPVKRYSSGMTVRLGFAVAAHLNAEILLVDEVLAVGDAEFQKKALGKMQEVSHDQGRTVLFVSHNMGAVRSICNKGLLLKNGILLRNVSDIEIIIDEYINEIYKHNNLTKIEDTTDRKGTGEIIITDFIINDNQKTHIFKSGEPLSVEIDYKSYTNTPQARFIVSLFNHEGVCISRFDSELDDAPLQISNQGRIKLIINDNFALPPGRYYFNAAIMSRNLLTDHIEKIKFFEIVSGNFFNNRKEPMGKMICYVKHKWVNL